MEQRIVTVFGGSGFVGRYVCAALAKAGYAVNVVSRTPERALEVKTAGAVGQVSITQGNIRDPKSIERAIQHSYAVVNLVGILYETRKQKFADVQAQGPERIAKIAKKSGIERFVHISALGVDRAPKSQYARTKLNGEKAIKAAFSNATILRPSIIFGPEDNFFNQFASLATKFRMLPLIGGGKTQFQPVYVGDVADAVVKVLEHEDTQGVTYELGGPKTYTFKELLEYIADTIECKCFFAPLPFVIAKLEATFLELMPAPLLTRDQVTLLQTDNIIVDGKHTFEDLSIAPKAVEKIVPKYLGRFKVG